MCLIALLVVRYRCMHTISFSLIISILFAAFNYKVPHLIYLSHSAFSYLYFLSYSVPNPESLTFKMSEWKLYIFNFGLQNVNTKTCFLPGLLFRGSFQYLAQ